MIFLYILINQMEKGKMNVQSEKNTIDNKR
jgi:hypothetical protein